MTSPPCSEDAALVGVDVAAAHVREHAPGEPEGVPVAFAPSGKRAGVEPEPGRRQENQSGHDRTDDPEDDPRPTVREGHGDHQAEHSAEQADELALPHGAPLGCGCRRGCC